MLCHYQEGRSFTEIAAFVSTTRRLVYECVDRALAMGPEVALRDLPHGKQEHTITAGRQSVGRAFGLLPNPRNWGMRRNCGPGERWPSTFARWPRPSGHPGLAQAGKATVQRILDEQELKPHKIRYYLERRDPDFEAKMCQVLLVYRELSMEPAQGVRTPEGRLVFTVSVDEKPGVQAIANTAADLPPVPGEHPAVGRDYEYRRLGTASILAGSGLGRWSCHRPGGTAPSQPRVYWLAQGFGCALPRRRRDPTDSGQSFGAHLQGNPSVFGHAAQSLLLCAYPHPRVLAEFGGNPIWENGANLSARDAGSVLGGTQGARPQGNCRDQCWRRSSIAGGSSRRWKCRYNTFPFQ